MIQKRLLEFAPVVAPVEEHSTRGSTQQPYKRRYFKLQEEQRQRQQQWTCIWAPIPTLFQLNFGSVLDLQKGDSKVPSVATTTISNWVHVLELSGFRHCPPQKYSQRRVCMVPMACCCRLSSQSNLVLLFSMARNVYTQLPVVV